MKVRCIDTGDIQNLQKDKIYEIKILDISRITLLDGKARAQYSHKRFNLIYEDNEIYLKDFIDNYKNKKVKYTYKVNSYLISYTNKFCDLNDIFIIFSIYRSFYGYKEYKLKNLSKNDYIYIRHNDIHTNFYNVNKDEAINMLRRNKILKLKEQLI